MIETYSGWRDVWDEIESWESVFSEEVIGWAWEFNTYKNEDLRQICKGLDLPVGGKRIALIRRLTEAAEKGIEYVHEGLEDIYKKTVSRIVWRQA